MMIQPCAPLPSGRRYSRIYDVYVDGALVGTWTSDNDPVEWDDRMLEFYRNDSTWCITNVLDQGVLDASMLKDMCLAELDRDCSICMSGRVRFRVRRVPASEVCTPEPG